jgi:signal transduction histidine kinase
VLREFHAQLDEQSKSFALSFRTIADNGIGIAAKQLVLVFERFCGVEAALEHYRAQNGTIAVTCESGREMVLSCWW